MAADFCPGSEKIRHPQPDTVRCSSCGVEVEIWTDEARAVCPSCKSSVTRGEGQSCLDWCKYGKECVGQRTYDKYMRDKSQTVRERLMKEMESYFGEDTKRINHARSVLRYAEELLKQEKGDWHIVIPASILHDVGIKVAEEKYGSSAGHYQEKEGPAVARKILLGLGFKKEDIDETCEIIAHHHTPGVVNTPNFRILYDADWLVNLKDEVDTKDRTKLRAIIDKVFLTDTGKALAKKIYLA